MKLTKTVLAISSATALALGLTSFGMADMANAEGHPDMAHHGTMHLIKSPTPDMHRVHHSVRPEETNSNFGFNLPWWDRLLGTYRAQPSAGHEDMSIGIEQFRTKRDLWLDRMLVQPIKGPASGYPIHRETGRKL